MIEFLVVMPKSVTKPTSDPTDKVPPDSNAARTPPTRANGKFASTSNVFRMFLNAMNSIRTIPTAATIEYARISRCAWQINRSLASA